MFRLAMRDAEFHLENTLLNGQCFNWWKHTKVFEDNPELVAAVYRGIYSTHFLEVERISDTEV